MPKYNHKYVHIAILLVVSILPTVLASISFLSIDKKTTVDLTVKSLYAIGKEQEKKINDWFNEIVYDMNFLREIESVKNLQKDKLAPVIEYIKTNRDIYKDIFILDKDFNVIYGYNYDNRNFKEKKHVRDAMAGNISFSDIIFFSNNPFVEVAVPIYNNNIIVGIIYSKINISSLNTIMQFSRLMNESTESYIVNKQGIFITESRFIPDAIGKKRIDIANTKLNIDYSNKTPYLDYRSTSVYGLYFALPYNNWTLIIEQDADDVHRNNNKIIATGELLSALEIVLVGVFQKILKTKFKISTTEDDEQEESNTK
ncbi:cache domain-containing protein [Tepidibacter thalassicus]|uniref:Cache domain-containing protein n=1 Tax=Tepidibacter thalassicus DSM 15285 TaxID=1123350 RepID=A0A1M5P102_9FIRM|nr:cache domain-containing protein [Tepidibacter thalassicus]SHG95452.1 hypothetical protein SAMN02744040_00328 [Tepidibacter thalassicus DSM 15285]